jgi:hypothetical protein
MGLTMRLGRFWLGCTVFASAAAVRSARRPQSGVAALSRASCCQRHCLRPPCGRHERLQRAAHTHATAEDPANCKMRGQWGGISGLTVQTMRVFGGMTRRVGSLRNSFPLAHFASRPPCQRELLVPISAAPTALTMPGAPSFPNAAADAALAAPGWLAAAGVLPTSCCCHRSSWWGACLARPPAWPRCAGGSGCNWMSPDAALAADAAGAPCRRPPSPSTALSTLYQRKSNRRCRVAVAS